MRGDYKMSLQRCQPDSFATEWWVFRLIATFLSDVSPSTQGFTLDWPLVYSQGKKWCVQGGTEPCFLLRTLVSRADRSQVSPPRVHFLSYSFLLSPCLSVHDDTGLISSWFLVPPMPLPESCRNNCEWISPHWEGHSLFPRAVSGDIFGTFVFKIFVVGGEQKSPTSL